MDNYKLHHGDNLATLKTYADNTFDSIITDPPYGIDFLGKDWDSHTGTVELYKECLRVLKPGGYLLAFSAARTYHKLAYSVELAGFEIRDQLMWLYSSGFPKAQDIGKAIQKRIGVEEFDRMVDTTKNAGFGQTDHARVRAGEEWSTQAKEVGVAKCTSPIAKEWEGYKTALKPAHEPIVMARKPFKGSTIDNVLKNGLGAMNIDETRIEYDIPPTHDIRIYKENQNNVSRDTENNDIEYGEYEIQGAPPGGRYPSNVIGEVAEGYQKYFYCPKVSRKERHVGFENIESTTDMVLSVGGHSVGPDGEHSNIPMKDCNHVWLPGLGEILMHGAKHEVQKMRAQNPNIGNNHPTVKPVALMEYLIKLVTPPSTPTLQRKVLDPFNGSGSTGMAAVALGHHYTGCDLDQKYIDISKTRIDAWNDNGLDPELFGDIEDEE